MQQLHYIHGLNFLKYMIYIECVEQEVDHVVEHARYRWVANEVLDVALDVALDVVNKVSAVLHVSIKPCVEEKVELAHAPPHPNNHFHFKKYYIV